MTPFTNIILLPPFAVVALLYLSSRDLSKMSQAISLASQNAKIKISSHNDLDAKDHSIVTNYILGLIRISYCFPNPLAL